MKHSSLSSKLDCLKSQDVHRLISEQVSDLSSNITEGYCCNRQTVSDMGAAFLITNLWIALRWRYCQRTR
jgi:hypothetical protein